MNAGINFGLGFASIWFVACVAEIVLRFFITGRRVRFGAFCVAIGFALAHFSGQAETGPQALYLISSILGAGLALSSLYYHWFRRGRSEITSNED